MAQDGGPRSKPEAPEDRRRSRRAVGWWWWVIGGGVLLLLVAALLVNLGGADEESDGGTAAAPTSPASGTETAAGSSPTSTADAATPIADDRPDIEGVWEFIVDVTETDGVCAGEEDETPGIDNITIRRVDGNTYAVTGFGSTPDDEWSGGWDGDDFIFSGERDEDEGRTEARFIMRFTDGGALVGEEDWSWRGASGTCSDGKSTVDAFFYAPLE